MRIRYALLFLMAAVVLAAFGLFYVASYNPVSTSGVGLPATVEPQ